MGRLMALALLAVSALAAGCDVSDASANGAAADRLADQRAQAAAVAGEGATVTAGYTLGSADAPVAVVEFSDFGCPYCARFARTTLPELRSDYVREGVVRWRYVPVTFGFRGGELMGAAAVCAGEMAGSEGFWRAHDLLYRNQTALRGEDARPRLLTYLAEMGLDRDRVDACLDDASTARILAENTRLAQEWFIGGTPSFVVNGVPMSGALPTEFFRKVFATVLDPSGL